MPAHKHLRRKSTNIAFISLSDLIHKIPSLKTAKKSSAIQVAVKNKTINGPLKFDKNILSESVSNYRIKLKQDNGVFQAVPDIPDTPPPPVRKKTQSTRKYKRSKIKKVHKTRRSKRGRR